jgi:hypothetical protein
MLENKNTEIEFKTNRIICLDRGDLLLFAEVIDTIPATARYWVRPLTIARSSPTSFQLEFLYDLRETADLILPIVLFRDALDTEVLPLVCELFQGEVDSSQATIARRALHQFIADLYPIA